MRKFINIRINQARALNLMRSPLANRSLAAHFIGIVSYILSDNNNDSIRVADILIT